MKKYGVSDTLTKAGGFLMQESERTNRKTAFIAHALQTVKNFGDPNMRIKKSDPARRKSFRARHNCDNPGPKWKARYWSCKAW